MSDGSSSNIRSHPVEQPDTQGPPRAVRNRLPSERLSRTHKFEIAGHEGYLIVGTYPNGQPGEIFITMAKEGSTIAGLMNSFALSISIALQHGVPLKLLCEKFSHTRFEPCGWTGNPEIGYAKSIMDYIFRWLHLRFIEGHQDTLFAKVALPGVPPTPMTEEVREIVDAPSGTDTSDAPPCRTCGAIMTRNGSCFRCGNCGSTSGCS